MLQLKYAIRLERLQLIKVEGSKEYRWGEVILIKPHLWSKKLIPFDYVTGKRILEMKHFDEVDKKYYHCKVDSFEKGRGAYSVIYDDPELEEEKDVAD